MPDSIDVAELTIDEVQQNYRRGTYRVRDVVQAYLHRIEQIDCSGPELNSVVALSEHALDEADELDRRFDETGELVGPLHGVPVLVKDQIEVGGTPTSFGSEIAADYVPTRDADVVRRLRDAGAVILGTTTMPDFATSWFSTSSRSGLTRNPYDLKRDAGGSSSGSAAAVAANLALVAIGGDTGGSIRLPASFCNLVGVRVTPGLISRDGMSSLVTPQDTPGPMTRTVLDSARLLDVMVGFDAKDPFTAAARIARHEGSFAAGLETATLSGKRLGVLRAAFGDADDAEAARVNAVVDRALAAMESAGVTVVDVSVQDLSSLVGFTSLYNTRSHSDMNAFFAERPDTGVPTMHEVVSSGRYDQHLDLLEGIAASSMEPSDDADYLDRILDQQTFQREVVALLAEHSLDAIVFPDVQLAAPTHEDVLSGRWTCLTYPTNTVIASQLHFPAVTVPVGFTDEELPVGLEIIGAPYDEQRLLYLAAGVEAATHARRAPNL